MKKLYLSLVFSCLIALHALAVDVSITMNSVSRTMTLAEKVSGNPVDVGTPGGTATSALYTFETDPGTYILTGYNASGVVTGTMEISVFEGGEMLDGGGQYGKIFKVTTITAYASNAGWLLGTDYDIECLATSREGVSRVITTTIGTVTVGRKTFLMQIGDTFTLNFTVNSTTATTGYISAFNHAGTVTAATANAAAAIPQKTVYSLLVPQASSLYVGGKRGAITQSSGGTHYVAFTEVLSDSIKTEGSSKRYYYTVGIGCWYNFRLSQTGKLTNGGKFQAPISGGSLTFTEADMNAQDPKMIDHDVTHNDGSNVADILLNINARGHLKMTQGGKYQLIKHRSWQLIDTQTNNYFIDPDYHYRIVDLNGNDISNVIRINEKDEIEALANGTAIVLITYDAISLKSYAQNGTATNYFFGPLFGAIWPENTGAFVVTVGGSEDPAIVTNMKIQEASRVGNSDGPGADVDSEHDVFYYLEGQPGYQYTFKPEGVSSVSIANPTLGTNSASYTGFQSIAANEDGTYTLLLTHGRNIVKLTSASGSSVYQMLSAKPAGYVISNKSRPGETILPGDDVYVQYHGLFHPANKLSGIYNMSAYIVYNSIPNGNSLILSPNQYQFGGKSSAQLAQYHIPTTARDSYRLGDGAIQVNGFGSAIGKHRDISIVGGINPNFTAVVRVTYFGSIPNIDIPLAPLTDGFKFEGLPEGVKVIVVNELGDTISSNSEGIFYGAPRAYSYEAFAHNRKALLGNLTVVDGQGVVAIDASMDEIASSDNSWDGTRISLPETVTAEESALVGGEFAGLKGYYKIKNGYELAWLSYYVNKTKNNSTTSAVLLRDINLSNFSWTPIGKTSSTPYAGKIEGRENTINNIYINNSNDKVALIGCTTDGARLADLTINGSITSTGSNVAGFIGDMEGYTIVENCHNQANISGSASVGGIVGYSYHYPMEGEAAATIENSSNSGTITGSGYVGGIGGRLSIFTYFVDSPTMKNLFNTGNVTVSGNYAGGIAGELSGFNNKNINLENVYNTGNITSTSSSPSNIGGIAGSGSNSYITNAYNTGVVTSGGSILGGSGTTVNVYTIAGSYKEGDNALVKSAESFASGEVAWLLGDAFGQTIGTDALPLLAGASVYQVNYSNNLDAETATIYTNGVLPQVTRTGYTSTWYSQAGGDVVTQVSDDANLYLQFDTATGTEENMLVDVNVFPNPFIDYVNIKASKAGQAEVYNLQGSLLHSFNISDGINRLELSSLPAGVYFLHFNNRVVKLVK